MESVKEKNPINCALDKLKERKITSAEFEIFMNSGQGLNKYYIISTIYDCKVLGRSSILVLKDLLPFKYN